MNTASPRVTGKTPLLVLSAQKPVGAWFMLSAVCLALNKNQSSHSKLRLTVMTALVKQYSRNLPVQTLVNHPQVEMRQIIVHIVLFVM